MFFVLFFLGALSAGWLLQTFFSCLEKALHGLAISLIDVKYIGRAYLTFNFVISSGKP